MPHSQSTACFTRTLVVGSLRLLAVAATVEVAPLGMLNPYTVTVCSQSSTLCSMSIVVIFYIVSVSSCRKTRNITCDVVYSLHSFRTEGLRANGTEGTKSHVPLVWLLGCMGGMVKTC